jgi:hypothetical protein
MIKNEKKQIEYIVEDAQSSIGELQENKLDNSKTLDYKIAVRKDNKKYFVGSIEIKLLKGVNLEIKEFKDRMLKWILFLLSFAFFQTIVLLGILYILERMDLFAVIVIGFKSPLIYPYETGGFFFALILISDIAVEYIRTKINDFLD